MSDVRMPASELRRTLELLEQLDEALFEIDINNLDTQTREYLAKRLKREFAAVARRLETEEGGPATVLDVYLHPMGRILEEALEEEERRLRTEI